MNIAILGYGIEGESVYRYFRGKYPDATITVYDNNVTPKNTLPGDVEFIGGVKDFKGIAADIAVKTPAIAPWDVEVSGAVTTVTREFLKSCKAPVIGITGTKGKGTTASLVKSILDSAGKRAWLVGNIGVSGLDVLDQIAPEDVVVYELSSFQLWDADCSPHVAVVLGIEPEHQDVHKDLDDYVGAKANIARYQGEDDILIYSAANNYARQISQLSSASKQSYPSEQTAHVKNGGFYYGEQYLCSITALQLPGEHNRENACAAIDAVWSWVKDGGSIERGLAAFQGLPHRLKLVRTVNGIDYYDDSIATTPGSAIAALAAFDRPKVLILGGSYKGASYDDLAQHIASNDTVRHVVLIGSEASKIEASLKNAGFVRYSNMGSAITMPDIVSTASTEAQHGDVVILSPACASFDMFKSYTDRGEQFIRAVRSL